MLSLQDSPRSSTHEGVPRWRHHKFYALRATSYRCTYKSRKFFFWFTSDAFRKRPILSYQDSYVNSYEEIYERRWYQKRTTYCIYWGVTQEYLKRLYRQTPLWLIVRSRSLKIPEEQEDYKTQEKGRWEISSNSHASHPLRSYADGYYSRLKYDVPWDWLREVCHMARVRWGTRCKGFRNEKGLHYRMEQNVRNQLERDQVRRALEKLSSSCLQTSNNQPYSRGRKSLGESSHGLYCVDLAEAYVTQEIVSLRI